MSTLLTVTIFVALWIPKATGLRSRGAGDRQRVQHSVQQAANPG
jgi:hypothetical protein